jgi:hypothetical protein
LLRPQGVGTVSLMSANPGIVRGAVKEHIRSSFSGRPIHVAPPVRHEGRLPDLCIFEVEPIAPDGLWAYVSCGASEIQPEHGERMEFVMLSPEESIRPAQLLRMTAWYHTNPDPSYQLDWGHTLPIGEPWLEGSQCDVLLVSKPHTLGPEFEVLTLDGLHVHFYWLLPITEAERRYRQDHGLEALEEKFEEARLPYWDPLRSSVV